MRYCVKMKPALTLLIILLIGLSTVKSKNLFSDDGWTVLHSGTDQLSLSYKPIILGFDTIYTTNKTKTILPKIKGANVNGEPGRTSQLEYYLNITVPGENDFVLSHFQIISYSKYSGILTPYPFLKKQIDYYGGEYRFDENKTNDVLDIKTIDLIYSGIARNRHIAKLTVNLVRNENGSFEIPNEIKIDIKFNSKVDSRSNAIKDKYDVPVSINHFETKNWLIGRQFPNEEVQKIERVQSDEVKAWVRLRIDKEGLYKITPANLSALGLNISKEDIQTIKIYGYGGLELDEKVPGDGYNYLNEQEIIVRTSANGGLEKILFYGSPTTGFKYVDNNFKHYINHYSNNSYYILTWGGSEGKRAVAEKSPDSAIVNYPSTYTNMIFFEEEMNNAFSEGSGRTWFGRNYMPVTFTKNLTGLDRIGEIKYKLSGATKSSEGGYFIIKESGKEISKLIMNGSGYESRRKSEIVTMPASQFPSNNQSALSFDYKNSDGSSSVMGYFDYYEIFYPAFLKPNENQIGYFTDPSITGITEYSVNGFTGSEIFGFDVTDVANPHQIENNSTTGGMFIFRTLQELKKPKRFFISSSELVPAAFDKITFANLSGEYANTDMILITHPQLIESALEYKKYRESKGEITVSVVTTEQIYNEFGYGIPDLTAIRNFISFAHYNWENQPGYILLWGDGHFDYKQIVTSKVNFVPTWETEDDTDYFDEISSFTTDDFYANIAGNDEIIDIAIGRLPVNSNESGNWLVEKIKLYENNSNIDTWRTKMTIVADDAATNNGNDGTLHTGQAESLWRGVPESFQVKKIYLPEFPTDNVTGGRRKPRVMEDIISTVNLDGTLLMSYIGHGNPRVWTHEEVFERSVTIPQMKNLDKLFFLTAASCDFGRFDKPEVRSGAEELVLSKVGGAIGVFSSARVVFATPNAMLNELYFANIFKRNPETGRFYTLGEVNRMTKSIKDSENDLKYHLLADPSLRLLSPENLTVIDSINHYSVSNNDTAYIEALSLVKIKGKITKPNTNETDGTFNGTVVITMLDSDQKMEVNEDDTIHRFIKNGGALNRSSYKVENGYFTAEFYIPKDISFAGTVGRLYAYAYSEDERFASGSTRKFIISGITGLPDPDISSPKIDIYLDSREFVSGEYVRCVPLLIVDLKDDRGINTTGLGLGHKIEAWIDDNVESIDLSNKFKTSLSDSRAGSVEEFIFELEPGIHKVKVRAWDVFNNFSIKETVFRTTTCDGIVIDGLQNYPNPAEENTVIKFNHNLSAPFEYELKVLNILGQDVGTFRGEIMTNHLGEIQWDCNDSSGNHVQAGNYLYVLNLMNSYGITGTARNIMSIVR